MTRSGIVRAALIQCTGITPHEAMIDKQVAFIRQAADQGAQVVCLQELATGPYFCQVETDDWFELAEPVEDGPTLARLQPLAAELGIVLVVPLFEIADGFYYNTAAVIDADGSFLGKYRKTHIPHGTLFYEKYYFKPGNSGYPVFDTAVGRIAVYICYDRHFPEGPRIYGIEGAEIVFMPSATAGASWDLWHTEQRGHAIANQYFVGTNNRVGVEETGPLDFYGNSYFVGPRGETLAQGGTGEEVVIADLDLGSLRRVRTETPFWRDRRPETYDLLVAP